MCSDLIGSLLVSLQLQWTYLLLQIYCFSVLLFIVSLCENRVSSISITITASGERERERERKRKRKREAYELRALLVGALVLRVDAREVGDDDGHRERND